MAQKKTITLDMLRAASDRAPERDTTTLPVFRLAALLYTFTADRLTDLLQRHFDTGLSEADWQALTQNSVALEPAGTYTLEDRVRTRTLASALQTGWLPQWIAQRRGAKGGKQPVIRLPQWITGSKLTTTERTERYLWAFLDAGRSRPPALYDQSMEELVATHRVVSWLVELPAAAQEKISTAWPTPAEVNAYIKREELLTPLRQITRDFQGRETELARLREYLTQPTDGRPRPSLLVSGIGGVGKSTLIAKFILDHSQYDRTRRIPFAYLDFDKSGFSISEPLTLASEVLRQLALQFPTQTIGEGDQRRAVADIMRDVRADIRSTITRRGTAKSKYRPPSLDKQQQSTISTRGNLYESISRQYLSPFAAELRDFSRPLLVVLDSFEEAQYRASSSEINNLLRFIEEVADAFPQLRLLIVGRNDLENTFFYPLDHLELKGFDAPSAIAYLRAAGIEDERLARALFREVGDNPLTLKLAARYVREEQERRPGKKLSIGELLEGIDTERAQEQLVRRNLLHIKHQQVRQLAFPGMLVRRISPDIIREVLAEPCGLGPISPEVAEHIFQRLRQEQFLLASENNQLVFRRDLRVTLYELVMKEYGPAAEAIHANALRYYRDRTDPASRAEYLYHWLKTGGDATQLTDVNWSELRPFIENYLAELPLNAYIYIAAQLGIRVQSDLVTRARLAEWEDYLVAQTEDALLRGELSDLEALQQRWAERTERTGRGTVSAVEGKLYSRVRIGSKQSPPPATPEPRKDTELDLGTVVLQGQQLEYQQEYEVCWRLLESVSESAFVEGRGYDQFYFLILFFRLACRLGRATPDFHERFASYYPRRKFDASDSERWLPLYYRPYYADLDTNKQNLVGNASLGQIQNALTRVLPRRILAATDFRALHAELLTNPDPRRWLDQRLKTQLELSVNDLSETGTVEVNLTDVLFYLELRLVGDVDRIRAVLGLSSATDRSASGSDTPRNSDSREGEAAVQRQALAGQVRQLIAKGRTEPAVQVLLDNQHLLLDYEKEVYLISSRLQAIEQENRIGVISREDYVIRLNQTNLALLEIVSQLSADRR